MISRILAASALAIALSTAGLVGGTMAHTTNNRTAGTGGDAGGATDAGGGSTTTTVQAVEGATSGTGGDAGAATDNSPTASTDSKSLFSSFYTDDSMKTPKSQDEIGSSFNAMSPGQQAVIRGNCDGADAVSACTMLPPKK